jgi:dTDP-4-amino-4,6-dideoxygalactose transaminase
LLQYLQRNEIDAVVRYPNPIHLQPVFKQFGWRRGEFPISERLADELLCLPLRPDMSEPELDEVAQAVRNFYARVPA